MSTKTVILTASNSTVNSTNNTYTLTLPQPFACRNQEVALANIFIYYSWFNVTSLNNNNSFSYKWADGTTHVVSLPDGFYTIYDINELLKIAMVSNSHYLIDGDGNNVYYLSMTTNSVYYSVTVEAEPVPISLPDGYTEPDGWGGYELAAKTPQLVISSNSFGELIGFAAGNFPTTQQSTSYSVNSTLTPNISPVNAINVTCNLCNNFSFNRISNVIYTFSPNVTFGSQIQLEPMNYIFFPATDRIYDEISVGFYDQDGNTLRILDPNVIVTLIIRDRRP